MRLGDSERHSLGALNADLASALAILDSTGVYKGCDLSAPLADVPTPWTAMPAWDVDDATPAFKDMAASPLGPAPLQPCSGSATFRKACQGSNTSCATHCPPLWPCLPMIQADETSEKDESHASAELARAISDCQRDLDASAHEQPESSCAVSYPPRAATITSSKLMLAHPSDDDGMQVYAQRPVTSPLEYSRTINNAMALRVLYIPLEMHDLLYLADMYPKRGYGGRRCRSCIVQLMLTEDGGPFPVTMAKSSACRHRRISTGWRAFCVSAGLQVGDRLTFSRGRLPDQLVVAVNKECDV